MKHTAKALIKCWLWIVLLLHKVQQKKGVRAVLTVTPVDTNVTAGSEARLSCSTDASKEVNWQYGHELNSVIDVYIAKEGMGRKYRKSIRFKIDSNTSTGQYDLVISNVTLEDNGFYICSEPGGWGPQPHARLTVTGGELPAKVCRENAVAIKAGKLKITFSSCNPEPHYLTHVPVGLSYSNDVYNLGKLLNSYADSGRFEVEAGSEELTLKVKNILLSDAGMYTCRGDSGHGERHDKELVVLDEMPTCVDNICDAECVNTTETNEVYCAVNYTGNCAPNLIWRDGYGNKSDSNVQEEFTDFNQTFSRVEIKTIVAIKSGGQLICHIESPSSDAEHKFQCNTSVAPDQCMEQQHGSSNEPTSVNTLLIASVVIAVFFIVVLIFIAICICLLWRRRKRKFLHTTTCVPESEALKDD